MMYKITVDLQILTGKFSDTETKQVPIFWELDLEQRDYGIKSFDVLIPDQSIEVYVNGNTETIWLENVKVEQPKVGRNGFYPILLEFHKDQWTIYF